MSNLACFLFHCHVLCVAVAAACDLYHKQTDGLHTVMYRIVFTLTTDVFLTYSSKSSLVALWLKLFNFLKLLFKKFESETRLHIRQNPVIHSNDTIFWAFLMGFFFCQMPIEAQKCLFDVNHISPSFFLHLLGEIEKSLQT